MSMRVNIALCDGTDIALFASGGYSPDVFLDLANRAASLANTTMALNAHYARQYEAGVEAKAVEDE